MRVYLISWIEFRIPYSGYRRLFLTHEILRLILSLLRDRGETVSPVFWILFSVLSQKKQRWVLGPNALANQRKLSAHLWRCVESSAKASVLLAHSEHDLVSQVVLQSEATIVLPSNMRDMQDSNPLRLERGLALSQSWESGQLEYLENFFLSSPPLLRRSFTTFWVELSHFQKKVQTWKSPVSEGNWRKTRGKSGIFRGGMVTFPSRTVSFSEQKSQFSEGKSWFSEDFPLKNVILQKKMKHVHFFLDKSKDLVTLDLVG